MNALYIVVVAQNIARKGDNAVYCTFLLEIFYPLCIWKHLDPVHCPLLLITDKEISLLQLRCFKCIYPPPIISEKESSQHISESKSWKWFQMWSRWVWRCCSSTRSRITEPDLKLLTYSPRGLWTKVVPSSAHIFQILCRKSLRCYTDRTIHRWLWSSPECHSGSQPTS